MEAAALKKKQEEEEKAAANALAAEKAAALQRKKVALEQYASVAKRLFTDESRFSQLDHRKLNAVVARLKTLALAFDADSDLKDVLALIGYAAYATDLSNCRVMIDLESIYGDKRSNSRSRSRSRSRESNRNNRHKDRKKNKKKKRKDKYRNLNEVSSSTSVSESDADPARNAIDRDKAIIRRNQEKSSKKITACDFAMHLIKEYVGAEIQLSAATQNVLARVLSAPFNPSKLKTIYDCKDMRPPLFLWIIIGAFLFHCEEKATGDEALMATVRELEIQLLKELRIDILRLHPRILNRVVLQVINANNTRLNTFISIYKQSVTNALTPNNMIGLNYHGGIPTNVCYEHWLGANCAASCKLLHVCPVAECDNQDHRLWECPNIKLKQETKLAVKGGISYYIWNPRNKRFNGRNRYNNNRFNGNHNRGNANRQR